MDQSFFQILSTGSLIELVGLLTGSFLFAIAGLKEVRSENHYGLLAITLSLFFGAGHLLLVYNIPEIGRWLFGQDGFLFQEWLTLICAPSLIATFVLRGLWELFRPNVRESTYAVFFGGSLYLCLFVIGADWGVEIRAFLALIWCLFLVTYEFVPRHA